MGKCWVKYRRYGTSGFVIPVRTLNHSRSRLRKTRTTQLESLPPSRLTLVDHSDDNLSAESQAKLQSVRLPENPASSSLQKDEEQMLFPGSQVTSEEFLLLIFSFVMRHNLPRSAAEDLLKIIKMMLPVESSIPGSLHQLQKGIPRKAGVSKIHFYCPDCHSNMNEEEDADITSCPTCIVTHNKLTLRAGGSFYVLFDLNALFSDFLTDKIISTELFSRLQARQQGGGTGFLCDITDGLKYKALELGPNDLTCTINTDGISPFKSSKFSLWPLLVSVNELSFKTRVRSTLIAGLWFGPKKPNVDSFLQHFVTQCQELGLRGINWELSGTIVNSRIYFPILSTDSVARCQCQGLKQFNGSYGCPWCLAKGESFQYGSKSRKWIYRDHRAPGRTHEQFLDHVTELCQMVANNSDASHYGIKSASQHLRLPAFDIVWGFIFDVMHSAFLGVTKSFTSYWIDSQHHSKPFYIGRQLSSVDKILSGCHVPSCVSRIIRPLEQRKFWKASEWRTWTYLAPLVLKRILPEPYLNHFSKYAAAIMLLSASAVSLSDIEESRKLLHEFVTEVEELYGPEYCLSNVHLLMHAPNSVENWGPLWCYSAFQFENYNGTLLRLFNGSRKIEIELSNKVDLLQGVYSYFRDRLANPTVDFALSLLRGTRSKVVRAKDSNVKFFGHAKVFYFTKVEQQRLIRQGIKCMRANSYVRFTVNSVLYATHAEGGKRRTNCFAAAGGRTYKILNAFEWKGVAFGFCKRVKVMQDPKNRHIYTVRGITDTPVILDLKTLNSKFLVVKPQQDVKYLVELPNVMEFE